MKRAAAFVLIVIMISAAVVGCGEPAETVDITAETRTEAVTDALTDALSETEAETSGEASTEEPPETAAELIELADVKIGGAPLSDFSVVIAADAPSGVKSAAEDLCRLVEFASGMKLPLKTEGEASGHYIILGETSLDGNAIKEARGQVKDDGYALLEDGGNLYISGAISRGTVNGVYDFLQDYLGVRFYSDTFTHVRDEYVKNVPAGQKTVYNPVFPGRYNWCELFEPLVAEVLILNTEVLVPVICSFSQQLALNAPLLYVSKSSLHGLATVTTIASQSVVKDVAADQLLRSSSPQRERT